MIRILTSCYSEEKVSRRDELVQCLQRNLALPAIDGIWAFLDGIEAPWISDSRLHVRSISHRPTYSDLFSWANELVTSDMDVTVIANSDIYFASSLKILGDQLKPDMVAALSRWDFGTAGEPLLFDRNDSQDAWVFRGPLKEINGDFCVGVPRCDNRFLYELKRAGYKVINPAFSIRTFHLHAGERPEYQNETLAHFVEPPYAYLYPHNLWSLPRTVIYNLRHKDMRISWRIDRRKISSSLPIRAVHKILRSLKAARGSPS